MVDHFAAWLYLCAKSESEAGKIPITAKYMNH